MTNLRKLARDQHCTVRLPGICNGDTSTTVLAHIRLIGISGAGMKAPDILGAWCCSSCHDAIDRRTQTDLETDYLRLAHWDGVGRTINELVKMGVIHA